MPVIIIGKSFSYYFIFRGFDFANHFVEYGLNYNVNAEPYYEVLPEKFPTEEQMIEFLYNYLSELESKKDDSELYNKAKNLYKVSF